jgi:hypothetical protein
MKILTEKEQLRLKLSEIDEAIKYSQDEVSEAYRRKKKKQNWLFISFVFDSYSSLEYKYKNKLTQLTLLREYRDIISNRIMV